MTPRYFTRHAQEWKLPAASADGWLNIVAHISIAGSEAWVGRTLTGELCPIWAEDVPHLPVRLRDAIHFHEASNGARIDVVADGVYFFAIDLLEQLEDVPGIDDPVRVFGTLTGPWSPQRDFAAHAMQGTLTLRRSELLWSLVFATDAAFHCAKSGPSRAQHSAVVVTPMPAARAQEIDTGAGVVLGFPLSPASLLSEDPCNIEIAHRMLYDVLQTLALDARDNTPEHALAQQNIPVPDRDEYIEALRKDGWAIEGDTAWKKPDAGVMRALSSVLGSWVSEQQKIPEQANFGKLAQLAKQFVPTIPGFPSDRLRALASCVRVGKIGAPIPVRATKLSASARSSTIPAASTPTTRGPTPKISTERDEWMKDFLEQDQLVGRAVKVTRSANVPPQATRAPEWMKDFKK